MKELSRQEVIDRILSNASSLVLWSVDSLTLCDIYASIVGGEIDITNESGDPVFIVKE